MEWLHYGRYLNERMRGKPTQYITHRQEFYGREFRVTPDVLIPRPETEHLVEAALGFARGRVVDVGTGSGAIAVTLALETPAFVIATDIVSMDVAERNARSLGAAVSFVQCDLLRAFADGSLDAVISNPPYVAAGADLPREVRDWEPGLALFAGEDGLAMYRRLIPEAARVLRSGGWLALELGFDSLPAVREMLGEGWRDVRVIDDLAGIPRVVICSKPLAI